ncbi:MAG: hypothetical protein K2K32_08705, partial [Muribaculaceae bacterium]|nr:hypothetical protein [Muribaculaceae bacterium]
LGLELIASKDSIKRMALNPTGINVALVKKNKKGIYYLETYSTDGEESKLMTFDAKHLGIPYAAAYTPDARQLVVATDNGTYLFETKKFRQIGEAQAFSNHPDMLVFSPNAYFLAAAGDKKVEVMNFEDKTMRRTLNPGENITDVVFSKSSEEMALLTDDGMVEIYDTRTFNVKMMIEDLDNGYACDFNFDGKYLAVAANDDKVTVVNLLKPEDRIIMDTPEAKISDVLFIVDSNDNPVLAASTQNGIRARRLQLEPYYAKLVSDEVDMKMSEWLKKMPNETMEEYQLRVNDETRAKQRRLFEDEISTSLAGNLTAMSTVSLGSYDAENEVLAVNFDNMPTIFLPIPREDLGAIDSANDFEISEQQYGLLGDDSFELIYAKFTNKKTGAEYIYDNVNRKPMEFMNNDNIVSIELVQQQMMEEIKLEELKEQVVQEAKKDNIISDHTQIAVNSEVIPEYDANGNKIMNYNVNFTYNVDPEFSAQEDFAPGKYRAEQSGAASSMLNIVKNAFEGDFSNYIKSGKRLNVKISGTADASPIRNTIAYDGAYGDIENEPIYQDNKMSAMTVTQKDGIKSNEQLAFLRAYGVKEFLENNVAGLNEMDTRYTYNIGVSEGKGSEFRRITVEFTFVDAF